MTSLLMPIEKIEFAGGGSERHRTDESSLSSRGITLPFVHRASSASVQNGRDDRWLRLVDKNDELHGGVVINVTPSRKLPLVRLGRIRCAGDLLKLTRPQITSFLGALQKDRPRLGRLSVQAYSLEEHSLEAMERTLRECGFQPEPMAKGYHTTSVVSLAGTEQDIQARFSYSARRGIRNAERSGFAVRPITDLTFAERMQQLDEAAHHRTGGQAARRDLGNAIQSSVSEPEFSAMLGVFHPGRNGPDALVGFVHGITAPSAIVYSTAGTDRAPDIGAAPIGYALTWALMQWGWKRGIPFFDFGGITPAMEPDHPLARITEFKRKFRGEDRRVASDWYIELSRGYGSLLRLADRISHFVRH